MTECQAHSVFGNNADPQLVPVSALADSRADETYLFEYWLTVCRARNSLKLKVSMLQRMTSDVDGFLVKR